MSAVAIIGGGLAGSAAALHLAAAGREVMLIEKEVAAHDKVCGEFLSHEAVGYLTALGIDLAALGAVAIDRVCFEGRARQLPFVARSVSRRVLDEALLQRAQDAGVNVMRGQKAQAIDQGRIRLDEGSLLYAPSIFLASGKHDMRGQKRPTGKQNDLVAFKMHWRLAAAQQQALAGAVELFLFPGGYGGLEPVEDGKANLCFLIQRTVLEKLDGDWQETLRHVCAASSLIAQRLAKAVPLWDKPLAITAIPYGFVRRTSDGLWYLGDQAAVIPSFSGDGMSIALHSARLASQMYLAGASAAKYQVQLAHDVERQVALATTISRSLVNPLGQSVCKLAATFMPQAIGVAARATRIPDRALLLA